MKIIHRYILGLTLRNLLLSLLVFVLLFAVIDFFDRIDNIMAEGASLWSMLQYFIYKMPLSLTLMLPVAMLVSTILTFGLLSRNSEVTAMRASGLKIFWIARPMFVVAFCLSLCAIALNEFVVPHTTRRMKEIYNLDIKQKDKTGTYSQENFWWRESNEFYSINMFDSRTSTLHGLSNFTLDEDYQVKRRIDASNTRWIDDNFGWSMQGVKEYTFTHSRKISGELIMRTRSYGELPLPIHASPTDFYNVRTDPDTMSYSELRKFIKTQKKNGIRVSDYMADLYAKLSFPFITIIVSLAVLPFALKPARSGSLAVTIIASLIIGFSYYAVHAFSLALGRAEIWPPVLAAWMANILFAFVGLVLSMGAESP